MPDPTNIAVKSKARKQTNKGTIASEPTALDLRAQILRSSLYPAKERVQYACDIHSYPNGVMKAFAQTIARECGGSAVGVDDAVVRAVILDDEDNGIYRRDGDHWRFLRVEEDQRRFEDQRLARATVRMALARTIVTKMLASREKNIAAFADKDVRFKATSEALRGARKPLNRLGVEIKYNTHDKSLYWYRGLRLVVVGAGEKPVDLKPALKALYDDNLAVPLPEAIEAFAQISVQRKIGSRDLSVQDNTTSLENFRVILCNPSRHQYLDTVRSIRFPRYRKEALDLIANCETTSQLEIELTQLLEEMEDAEGAAGWLDDNPATTL